MYVSTDLQAGATYLFCASVFWIVCPSLESTLEVAVSKMHLTALLLWSLVIQIELFGLSNMV